MYGRNKVPRQAPCAFDALNCRCTMGKDSMGADGLADSALRDMRNVLADQEHYIQELRLENVEQAARLREYELKARYYDAVIQSQKLFPITMIAREYGVSARVLNRYLRARGVQYPCGSTWALHQPYAGKGFVYPDTILYDRGQHTRWTPKGRVFLHDFLLNDGILPLYERPCVPMDMDDPRW